MQDNFELGNDDVVLSSDMADLVGKNIFQYSELDRHFKDWVRSKGLVNSLLERGIRCQFLTTSGGGWKKGKFCIRLEFTPDPDPDAVKIESPMDEFCQVSVEESASVLTLLPDGR